MNVAVALGLFVAGGLLGLALNPLITRMSQDSKAAHSLPAPRYTLLGSPAWLGIVVALVVALMALALYRWYGLSWRWLYWFAASVVLTIVGTVDWKVRLIDVLLVLLATVVAVALAQPLGVGWRNSLLGVIIAAIVFLLFFMLARLMFPGPGVPFGLGDVYLAMFIGGLVGFTNLAASLFYGMALAGIVSIGILAARQMGRAIEPYISYGTYLCLGVLIYLALFPLP